MHSALTERVVSLTEILRNLGHFSLLAPHRILWPTYFTTNNDKRTKSYDDFVFGCSVKEGSAETQDGLWTVS